MKPPARRPAAAPSSPRGPARGAAPAPGSPGRAASVPGRPGGAPSGPPGGRPPEPQPLGDDELAALQAQLDSLVPAREPLDVTMVDGYLCGVLLQPEPVPEARWLPLILDVDGRPPPPGFDVAPVRGWVRRRHAELDRAIDRRDWFDPWVYELDEAASPSDTVLPWVAGFATAVDAFTTLMDRHEPELLEPLATLYRHLDPDDLEDADELLAEIETYEPPATIDEAVEDLVRSVLLIADVSRPQRQAPPPARRPPGPGAPQRPRSAAAQRGGGPAGPGSPKPPRGPRGPGR